MFHDLKENSSLINSKLVSCGVVCNVGFPRVVLVSPCMHKYFIVTERLLPELGGRVRDALGEDHDEPLLLGDDVPLRVLTLLLRRHPEPDTQ